MKKLMTVVCTVALAGSMNVAMAGGNVAAGKSKSASCMGCHGANGQGNPALKAPALAGKKVSFLKKQLKDFRSKKRQSPTMNAMAAGLSDADIANLAAYYSSLKK